MFDRHVDDLASFFDRHDSWLDKTFVGCNIQRLYTCEDFFVYSLVDFDAVSFDKGLASLEVTFRFYALNFLKQFTEQTSQCFLVANDEIGLAVIDDFFDDIVLKTFLV